MFWFKFSQEVSLCELFVTELSFVLEVGVFKVFSLVVQEYRENTKNKKYINVFFIIELLMLRYNHIIKKIIKKHLRIIITLFQFLWQNFRIPLFFQVEGVQNYFLVYQKLV